MTSLAGRILHFFGGDVYDSAREALELAVAREKATHRKHKELRATVAKYQRAVEQNHFREHVEMQFGGGK